MLDDIIKGINGPHDKRFKLCLMEKSTGTIIFAVPNTKDQAEKEGVLEEQIYQRLIQFANMYNDYKKSIEEVQGYLRALCNHLPMDKPWIVEVSERAGHRYLKAIQKAKSMRDKIIAGEMFLNVKDVKNDSEGEDNV